MINPNELLNALVETLRDVPELVAELQEDPDRIYAYKDSYPQKSSLHVALHEMQVPSLMVVWAGTVPGTMTTNEVWKHQFHIYARVADYATLFRLLTKGKPSGGDLTLLQTDIHPNCYPMDPPSIERQADDEGLDFCLVAMTFTEIGDE